MPADVRERTRDAVRAQLAELAFTFFLTNGFDESTVDEAAKAAGISRATYFRYFGSKEDAVLVALEASDVDYGSTLRDRPIAARQSAWSYLREAFEATVVAVENDPGRIRAKATMIGSIPSLRAHLSERRRAREDRLVATVRDRFDDELTAKIVVAASFAAFDVAWREWIGQPDAPFRTILDDAFSRLDSLGHR